MTEPQLERFDKLVTEAMAAGGHAVHRPVVLLATKTMDPATLESDPDIQQLSARFDIQLAESPARALIMARKVRLSRRRVVLLLSDMLSNGSDVIQFISEFNQEWPEAGLHLFDSMEGRVIFTEPNTADDNQSPVIRIESNGRESLDTRLLLKMVGRYFPETDNTD